MYWGELTWTYRLSVEAGLAPAILYVLEYKGFKVKLSSTRSAIAYMIVVATEPTSPWVFVFL